MIYKFGFENIICIKYKFLWSDTQNHLVAFADFFLQQFSSEDYI